MMPTSNAAGYRSRMAERAAKSLYEWLPPNFFRREPMLRYTLRGQPGMTEAEAIQLIIVALEMRASQLQPVQIRQLRSFMRDIR
jgi:hypothetical protein